MSSSLLVLDCSVLYLDKYWSVKYFHNMQKQTDLAEPLAPLPTRKRAARLASGGTIREAAARLFLDHGYQGTSMDDIAAAAGVSKQTIYTHFSSKEQLFGELVLSNADRVSQFLDRIEALVAQPR